MRAVLIVAAAAGALGAAVVVARKQFPEQVAGIESSAVVVAENAVDVVEGALKTVGIKIRDWRAVAYAPANERFVQALHHAEANNGIPPDLLVRVAYQESRFRPDIISGQTRSSAGAVGIMQIVPRFHPAVDPLDPIASIHYAGSFLRQMFDRFGTWELALRAYNWGPGNVKNYLAGKSTAVPRETVNYSSQILADLGQGVPVA